MYLFLFDKSQYSLLHKKIYHGVFIVRSMFYDLHIFDEDEGISSTNTIHWVSEWVEREGRALRVEDVNLPS